MARTRHVGVLLVVATLLLWGSAAAASTSLSTGGGAVDTASTAQVQQQEENASVTFEDQTVENGTVTVANVTVPEGGYVTIHNDSLRDGQAVGSVIGVSEYLEPGTHENVTVTLYEGVEGANFENATTPNGTQTLFAMPHMETSGEMADNETTTTTTTDGLNDTETTTTTEAGANDTETTTTEAGTNDTETTTTTEAGANETETTTTTEAGANDTETTTTEAGTNDTETTTTTEAGANDTETTTTEAGTNDTETTTQQNQTYDFVATNGQEDGPYVVDGAVVTDSAEVDFAAPTTDDGAGAGGAETNDTQANETQAESGFVVESIEAPSLAASNATITVNATISNSADEERSEDVAFRLAGGDADVVVRQNVTVEAAGSETVTFDLNAADVGEGEYIHGVTTENSSKFATIQITDDAQVVFGDQETEGDTVTVESVYLPEGGYVALHDASLLAGDAVGSVVGVSEYLEPGVHENVSVTLSEGGAAAQDNASDQGQNASAQANGSQPIVAMAHMETTDDEEFDFVESDGEDDGPYTVDGVPVADAGNLTVALQNVPSGVTQDPNEN